MLLHIPVYRWIATAIDNLGVQIPIDSVAKVIEENFLKRFE